MRLSTLLEDQVNVHLAKRLRAGQAQVPLHRRATKTLKLILQQAHAHTHTHNAVEMSAVTYAADNQEAVAIVSACVCGVCLYVCSSVCPLNDSFEPVASVNAANGNSSDASQWP